MHTVLIVLATLVGAGIVGLLIWLALMAFARSMSDRVYGRKPYTSTGSHP